jgi:muramidase (phage lysozyme)
MGGGKTSTSTQSVSIPPEVLARYNAVNARAESVAQQPFQPYSGEFVAPLNPVQTAGINATSQASQLAQPYYGAGAGLTLAGAQDVGPLTQGQIGYYQNPYTQAVVNPTVAALGQQFGQQNAAQQAQAIKAGAFGGERAGLQRAQLAGQQALTAGQAIAPLYQQGYQQAVQTAGQQQGVVAQDLARRLQAGQQIAGLGTGAQQAALQGAQAQIGAGTLGQQTQQAQDTAQYQQYLQQQGYPFQVAQFLANIAEGTGALSGSTTTTTQPRGFFSNRGGFKTGESLHRTGKAYGGGLMPNSMGGPVYEPGAFERGGYATDGGVPMDIQSALAAHKAAVMAGPWAGQKLPNVVPSPMTRPERALQLMRPSMPLKQEATTGQQLLGGLSAGARISEDLPKAKQGLQDLYNWSKKQASGTDTQQQPAPQEQPAAAPTPPVIPPEIAAARKQRNAEMEPDQTFEPTPSFAARGGGIMPREHYNPGGTVDPYKAMDLNKGYIDPTMEEQDQAKKPGLDSKSGGLGPSGGGLGGDLMKAAGLIGAGKTLASGASSLMEFLPIIFAANGGVIPRQHHAGGNRANSDVPADFSPEADLPSPNAREAGLVVPRQQTDQGQPNIKVSPVELGDLTPRQQQFLNELSGPESGGKYNIRYGGLGSKGKEFDISGAHPNVLEETHDGQRSSAAGRYQFTGSTWRDIAGDAPMFPGYQNAAALKLARQEYEQKTGRNFDEDLEAKGFTPEMKSALAGRWVSLAGRGASSGKQNESSGIMPAAPKNAAGQPQDWSDFLTSPRFLTPLGTGLLTMASSQSRSPFAAALQGLGAGLQATQPSEARDVTTERERVGIASDTMDIARKSVFQEGGVIWVITKDKGMMSADQWDAAGRPELIGGDVAVSRVNALRGAQKATAGLGAAKTQGQPQAQPQEGEGLKPKTAPPAPPAPEAPKLEGYTPSNSALAAAAKDHHLASPYSFDPSTRAGALDDANNARISSREIQKNNSPLTTGINQLAIPLMSLHASGEIPSGVFSGIYSKGANAANYMLDVLDPKKQIGRFSEQGTQYIGEAQKAAANVLKYSSGSLGADTNAKLDVFQQGTADPSKLATVNADVLAQAYRQKREAFDQASYARALQEKFPNAGKSILQSFKADPRFSDKRYNEDQGAIKDFLLKGVVNGEHLLKYLVPTDLPKNEDLARKITPEVMRDYFIKKYGRDLTPYFAN